ncbi:MAG: hypothetical protein WC655_27320, partial [Candidatus Hydrogenedentales bacterium]
AVKWARVRAKAYRIPEYFSFRAAISIKRDLILKTKGGMTVAEGALFKITQVDVGNKCVSRPQRCAGFSA